MSNTVTWGLIGVGHIGGSIALAARKAGLADKMIGVDINEKNIRTALDLGIIDESMSLEKVMILADLIIVAIPVGGMISLLPHILNLSQPHQIIIDVGSTKTRVLESIQNHIHRSRFVSTHPMAGTEYSGPEAALVDLFKDKTCVLVDTNDSDPSKVQAIEKLLNALQMKPVYLDAKSHDLHTAYVSHISHISSFALALTVLEKEKDENRIFELASGGFSSTVRLAKSSPDMWVPIFEQNRDNVLDVLDEHINSLARFRSLLIKKDFKAFRELIQEANQIRKIIK